MPPRFRSGLIAMTAALGLLVVGCGSDEPSGSDGPTPDKSSATADPSAAAKPSKKASKRASGTTIDITFKGDTVDPNGVEKKVAAGKPITLHIVADQPGELHIHSSPEQQIKYAAGTSKKKLTIDRPGIVEVESHDLEQLVVVLEVR